MCVVGALVDVQSWAAVEARSREVFFGRDSIAHVRLQTPVVFLVRTAMICSGKYMHGPKMEVLDGIARVLEDVAPWFCMYQRTAEAAAAAASKERGLPGVRASSRVAQRTLLPIIFTYGTDHRGRGKQLVVAE
jgi:hypothetical protein